MGGPPTLRDVSVLAGVSPKTVSRVINNDPAVSPPTAERVRAAVRELGFRPNPVARWLRSGQDDAVGLIVEDIADPFMAELASAVENAAREEGRFVVLSSAGYAPEHERTLVTGLANRRVAGLILTPSSGDHSYLAQERAIPMVFIDRPPIQYDCDTVLVDNEGGARLGTAHLIKHGHRRIAFVGDRSHVYTIRMRYQGFRAAMADAGLPVDERLVHFHGDTARGSSHVMAQMLDAADGPTAVISSDIMSSLGAATALHQRGRADIGFVSFDDFHGAESLTPAVTVVYQDPRQMGREAARLLFDRINGASGPPRRIVLPVQLIARGSGELPPPFDRRGEAPARQSG